jgi:hypothetical protein
MHTAGARILREDEQQDLSREAVLLQWERKIEEDERRPRRFERSAEPLEEEERRPRRFERSAGRPEAVEEGPDPFERSATAGEEPHRIGRAVRSTEDATHEGPRRFAPAPPVALAPVAERRTITITGQPTPPRRRRSMVESQLAQPDRVALWAFLLGLFLVVVAAGTAHA